ncbi:MAG: putative replicase protein [Tuwendivirus faecivivens]|uniref:RNA-directed RNA polymerase n=1 Tax=Leviviridae sp. TaxID=2027243 RepID=A0ABY3SSH0_9VIRU|nr:MAG: putative replicase protein [Leviviridae sp.]
MTKSYQLCLSGVLKALFLDAKSSFPDCHLELEKDESRLLRCVDRRGIRVYTLDLPALGKHFDKCLADGAWSKCGLALSRVVGSGSDLALPALFGSLLIRVFDASGVLRPDPDIGAIAFLRQFYCFGKKVMLPCADSATFESVEEFYRVDEAISRPNLDWDGSDFDSSEARKFDLVSFRDLGWNGRRDYGESFWSFPGAGFEDDEHLSIGLLLSIQHVSDILAWELGYFSPKKFRPKHGPGAVSDLKGGRFKYAFPSWPERLSTVFPYSEFAFANEGLWSDAAQAEFLGEASSLTCEEPVSKLCIVPKTQKSPRLIAAEPVAHQWCQQIVWDFFRERYLSSPILSKFVHFHDQTWNQDLARRASIDGSHWTVDLSSASDRLSCRLVERIFRASPALLDALYASRTRFIVQDVDKKSPMMHKLKKFSTMGSACTFPVQSHVFLCIALGACRYLDGKGAFRTKEELLDYAGEVLVFGDDLIVPSDAGKYLESALGYLGFKVNQSKTYRTGRFRESCGLDAFAGHDVTPAYVTRPVQASNPESIVSIVECANNFHMKGYWHAAAELRSTVPPGLLIPVVGADSGLWGDRSFSGSYVDHLQKRWNSKLQRWEMRVHRVSADVSRYDQSHWGQLLQFFTEDPDPEILWSSGAVGKARTKLRRAWVPLLVSNKAQ